MSNAERDAEIVAYRQDGATLDELAEAFALSERRVLEILRRAADDVKRVAYLRRVDRANLVERIVALTPSWRDLHALGRWLADEQWQRTFAIPADYYRANDMLKDWLDGRANDHMTVLRLRRLTEVPA